MSLIKPFDNAYADAIRKGWSYIYVFLDLHSTLIKPNYTAGNIPTEFYKGALEGLKIMSAAQDIKIIMYTCSHPHEIEQYEKMFSRYGVKFDFINENPEVTSTPQGYGCYDVKPYFNILIDDKAGFDAEEDWDELLGYLHGRYGSVLRTSQEWFQLTNARCSSVIYDPDGWDRSNYDYSFNEELITHDEYLKRLSVSTILIIG